MQNFINQSIAWIKANKTICYIVGGVVAAGVAAWYFMSSKPKNW